MPVVKVKPLHPKAVLPQYMSSGAAGCDVVAVVDAPVILESLERAAVPTGLALEIPKGYEVQVRPRSGLALKKGLTVVNAPGTIDSDYRGELKVLLINLSKERVVIESGERIAQLVVQTAPQAEWQWAETLSETGRGVGGFGSTGITAAP
jgi:dUTP pyrophosphatase